MTRRKKTAAPKKPRKSAPRRAIDARALIDALEQHVLGTKKMTATQVNAALALLKKILPDLPAQAVAPDSADKKAAPLHEDALRALE